MVAMSGVTLSAQAVRRQIADAVQLIVQIARMRDGVRRVTRVSEVVGMEGDVITLKDLFGFEASGEERAGRLDGEFRGSGYRPHFLSKAAHFGLDNRLLEALGCSA
jgi:pilus assembly protein CpaF